MSLELEKCYVQVQARLKQLSKMFKVQVRGPNGFVVEFSIDKKEITLGRDPESDIYLPSSMASRHHALIYVRNSQVYVEDLRSSNGTFVRDQKVVMPVLITPEDPVKMGDVNLKVIYEAKNPVSAPVDSGSYSMAQRLGNKNNTMQLKRGDDAKLKEMLQNAVSSSGAFKTIK